MKWIEINAQYVYYNDIHAKIKISIAIELDINIKILDLNYLLV